MLAEWVSNTWKNSRASPVLIKGCWFKSQETLIQYRKGSWEAMSENSHYNSALSQLSTSWFLYYYEFNDFTYHLKTPAHREVFRCLGDRIRLSLGYLDCSNPCGNTIRHRINESAWDYLFDYTDDQNESRSKLLVNTTNQMRIGVLQTVWENWHYLQQPYLSRTCPKWQLQRSRSRGLALLGSL